MADRPIIFSAPMVLALLAGRKTQTRRLAWRSDVPARLHEKTATPGTPIGASPWQLAKPGDRLWVRETVACGACARGRPSHWAPSFWRREQGSAKNPSGLWYQADGLEPETQITTRGRWVPSIHMPRWASRLTLTVTDVRVQRLQEISEADAKAEGIYWSEDFDGWTSGAGADESCDFHQRFPSIAFSKLWRRLHTEAPARWEDNPEVVALTFTVERRNIDA